MGKVDGRVALVTGAGRGIGRATALKLAAEGAKVAVNDLDSRPADDVVAEIRDLGGEAEALPGNVAEPGFADDFVGRAATRFGSIDIIVNNAGYIWDSVIQKQTDEQWSAVLEVHLAAPFRILRAAQPVIRDLAKREMAEGTARPRKVVNVSSVSGVNGNAGQVNYSAAKAGVIGLTKSLAKEWGRYNVNVNCVAFGLIHTRATEVRADSGATVRILDRDLPVGLSAETWEHVGEMIPLGRAGTVEEAAGAIAMLTYPESDYISGQVLVAAGGR